MSTRRGKLEALLFFPFLDFPPADLVDLSSDSPTAFPRFFFALLGFFLLESFETDIVSVPLELD